MSTTERYEQHGTAEKPGAVGFTWAFGGGQRAAEEEAGKVGLSQAREAVYVSRAQTLSFRRQG